MSTITKFANQIETPAVFENEEWHPLTWNKKEITQLPLYPDTRELQKSYNELSKLPPLITSWEIEALKAKLADVAAGDRSEEHTSELQSRGHLVCRLLLEKKK